MGYLLDKVDQAEPLEPAGRRPQRAAAERREPAVRHRGGGAVPSAVPEGASVLRQRHRIARRHPGGEARGREELLQAVLRAEQREPRDRRRHRQGARPRRWSRSTSARFKQGQPGAEAVGPDAADHRRAARRRDGSRRAAARLHGVADVADLSSRATPTPTSPPPRSAAASRAVCTRSSSTRSRSPRTSTRSSTR